MGKWLTLAAERNSRVRVTAKVHCSALFTDRGVGQSNVREVLCSRIHETHKRYQSLWLFRVVSEMIEDEILWVKTL